jgi:hypothetical protein
MRVVGQLRAEYEAMAKAALLVIILGQHKRNVKTLDNCQGACYNEYER